MKPHKIIYPNQEDVWEKASSYLLNLIQNQPCIKKAYVWASLAEGLFGLYNKEYQGRVGSDIDLVIILNEDKKIPKKWKYTGIEKSCFKLYKIGEFEYNGNIHPIDGLIVFPSLHDLKKVDKMIKDRNKRLI